MSYLSTIVNSNAFTIFSILVFVLAGISFIIFMVMFLSQEYEPYWWEENDTKEW